MPIIWQLTAVLEPSIETALVLFSLNQRTSISVDVIHYQQAGTKSTHLCKSLSIPAGDAVEIVQGKIVLVGNDDISVVSDTASSADAILSVLFDA